MSKSKNISPPPERILFGQFLIDKRRINKTTLGYALNTQERERMSDKPRMLGAILLNDFNVFKNRMELQRFLREFEEYKRLMQGIYDEANSIPEYVEELTAEKELMLQPSVRDEFLEYADLVIDDIKSRKYTKEELRAVLTKLADVRQAVISLTEQG